MICFYRAGLPHRDAQIETFLCIFMSNPHDYSSKIENFQIFENDWPQGTTDVDSLMACIIFTFVFLFHVERENNENDCPVRMQSEKLM